MFYTEPPSPPPEKPQSSLSWSSFNPGEFKQDLVTLPLEGALIGALNYFYTPRSDSIWPFINENENAPLSNTSLPRTTLFPVALGASALVLGGLSLTNNDLSLGTQIRGWGHAILLTELATTAAKVTVQRERPFYDTEQKTYGKTSDDDRLSFFSSHSSHAFSFATYSSALMFTYSNSTWLNWTYAITAYSAATWVASTRVTDNAHHVSDVVAGGIVGTAIAALVFYRVQQVDKIQKANSSSGSKLQINPFTFNDNSNKVWYGANLDFRF